VICDADAVFLWRNGDCPASVHDSVVFNTSQLAQYLDEHGLHGYHVASDAAYVEREWMLTPWPNPRNGRMAPCRDAFNFLHSHERQVTERAFGMLVGRWLILERPLKIPISRVHSVVTCCMRLQNVCIRNGQRASMDNGVRSAAGTERAEVRHYEQQPPRVFLASQLGERSFNASRGRSSSRRDEITAAARLLSAGTASDGRDSCARLRVDTVADDAACVTPVLTEW